MGFRLVRKSIKLAMRSRRRFIVFTLMYTVLMVWMAWNFEEFFKSGSTNRNLLLLIISILSTIILAILYAFIVINYRKQEIATLKCIGYTNGNVRTIIIGELVWVTIVSFIIVAELLIHATAVTTYIANIRNITDAEYVSFTEPYLNGLPVLITFSMFLIAQILGILVMYRKILNLRPIVALRVLK